MQITNPIIPAKATEILTTANAELDFKAICVFTAIGFFLDDDTYWTHKKILQPASKSTIENNKLVKSESYFKWHYSPRNISFNEALDEFTTLFETIISEQTKGQKVILPLSGGLDSRTQAVALARIGADVNCYSYEFANGYPETTIAKKIAEICGFDFQSFTINKGYLWNVLDGLADLNKCYSDFTSPRQMAIIGEFSEMGDVFSLGHWGDVLFDSYNVDELSHEEQVQFLTRKLLKRGGLQFATDLWNSWDLNGDFKTYFDNRISDLLSTIKIDNTNARLRAFKSKYWAPRWTSVNLSIFESVKPIALPYYDNRMCEFICTIPEAFLKDRQLQIEYIKSRNPELAKLVWQDKRPYNLNNYKTPNMAKTYSYRILNKLNRTSSKVIGKPYVQRNWELNFLGATNKKKLKSVFEYSEIDTLVSAKIINKCIRDFYSKNPLENAHALNILLVLAKCASLYKHTI